MQLHHYIPTNVTWEVSVLFENNVLWTVKLTGRQEVTRAATYVFFIIEAVAKKEFWELAIAPGNIFKPMLDTLANSVLTDEDWKRIAENHPMLSKIEIIARDSDGKDIEPVSSLSMELGVEKEGQIIT